MLSVTSQNCHLFLGNSIPTFKYVGLLLPRGKTGLDFPALLTAKHSQTTPTAHKHSTSLYVRHSCKHRNIHKLNLTINPLETQLTGGIASGTLWSPWVPNTQKMRKIHHGLIMA